MSSGEKTLLSFCRSNRIYPSTKTLWVLEISIKQFCVIYYECTNNKDRLACFSLLWTKALCAIGSLKPAVVTPFVDKIYPFLQSINEERDCSETKVNSKYCATGESSYHFLLFENLLRESLYLYFRSLWYVRYFFKVQLDTRNQTKWDLLSIRSLKIVIYGRLIK